MTGREDAPPRDLCAAKVPASASARFREKSYFSTRGMMIRRYDDGLAERTSDAVADSSGVSKYRRIRRLSCIIIPKAAGWEVHIQSSRGRQRQRQKCFDSRAKGQSRRTAKSSASAKEHEVESGGKSLAHVAGEKLRESSLARTRGGKEEERRQREQARERGEPAARVLHGAATRRASEIASAPRRGRSSRGQRGGEGRA